LAAFLSRRDNQGDVSQLTEYAIPEIDLVIVDLYPLKAPLLRELRSRKLLKKLILAVFRSSGRQPKILRMW
jgi:AICAR transformylase/IMP cyclohydrolase PurH